MTSENRGGAGETASEAARDAAVFALYRRRLERAIATSYDPEQPWAARVATAIRAALAFAEANPLAAQVLTVHAAFRRVDGSAAFTAMVDRFATSLNHDAPPLGRPERTARNIVIRIARQTLLHLETRPGASPTEIAPDLIVFALTPYVGLSEAQRWAAPAGAAGPIL